MSIIIRLQNLPLVANSMDIRRYFGGLVIPPAGVHIIGGEKGDAFIAFATDEDARQAMERDNGKIKDTRIKLLLSSRSEMQRVIEIARNQTLIAQGLLPAPTSSTSSSSSSTSKSNRKGSNSPDRRRSRSPDRRRDRDHKSSKKSKRRSRSRSPKRSHRDRETSRRREKSPEKSSSKTSNNNKNDRNDSPDIIPLPKEDNSQSSLDNGQVKITTEVSSLQQPRETNQAVVMPVVSNSESISNQSAPDNQFVENANSQLSQPADLRFMQQSMVSSTQPLMQNIGFPPLFPIIQPDLIQQQQPNNMNINNMGMNNMVDPNFANRLGYEGMQYPVTTTTDNLQDKRDPPVWQNPTALPFNLLQMTQPIGNLAVNPIIDRPVMGQQMNQNVDSNLGGGSSRPLRPMQLDHQSQRRRIPSEERDTFDLDRGYSRRNGGRDDANSQGSTSSRPSERERDRFKDSRFRGYCIEMRNLPFAITYREIREFLKGCRMPQDSLALVEISGRRTGVGYALMNSERDVQEALRKHKSLMLNRRIEITRCDEEDFYEAYKSCGNRRSKPHERSEDLVIALKGLPFSSMEKDIVEFLGGLDVADVVVEFDETGKTVGNAYVRFSHIDDYKIALTLDGKKLLHRYIEILPSTIETMYKASKYSPAPLNRPAFPKTGPMGEEIMNNIRPNNSSFAVSLRGLPPNIMDRDIAQFFSTVNVVPQAIHIMVNPNGLPSGDAFAEFSVMADFEKALKQDGEFIAGRLIRINPITLDMMHEILGRPAVNPRMDNNRLGPRMGPDFDMMDEMEKRRFMDKVEMMNGPPGQFPVGTQGPGFNGPPRGPMGGPPFPMMGGPPRFPPRPMIRTMGPDNFGKPGCVVSARNLSFQAKDLDILELFRAYNLNASNIIRRFDGMGNVTGEARIDFNTPEDASRAITEFSGKMFMGRNVILSKP